MAGPDLWKALMPTWLQVVLAVGPVACSALATVAILTWWLGKQFSANRKEFHTVIEKHETQDATRHAQNIERMHKIERVLVSLGWKNGTE